MNCGVALAKSGVFDRHNVEVLGHRPFHRSRTPRTGSSSTPAWLKSA
ncbi:MAG: hypothetical protein M0C28_32165 [Candidatus Moduliflexus flocculans]|nr:hypothetical protein [Candidatus Moduliflexus flocculans]